MAKDSWKQIYPRDVYRVLLLLAGETGLSFPKVVNIAIREGLIALGKLPQSSSAAKLLVATPVFEVDPREKQKTEELTARLQNVLKEWDSMKPKAREYYLKKAEENRELPVAQEILAKKGNEK